ncbi:MAG: hypothetical protein IPI35_33725 [Deltaproteobacteria bacterium]|nr:hypothetical protein [Deltaproteobacteria bacterium]
MRVPSHDHCHLIPLAQGPRLQMRPAPAAPYALSVGPVTYGLGASFWPA